MPSSNGIGIPFRRSNCLHHLQWAIHRRQQPQSVSDGVDRVDYLRTAIGSHRTCPHAHTFLCISSHAIVSGCVMLFHCWPLFAHLQSTLQLIVIGFHLAMKFILYFCFIANASFVTSLGLVFSSLRVHVKNNYLLLLKLFNYTYCSSLFRWWP